MNRARIAKLLRELADEFDAAATPPPAPKRSAPRRRRSATPPKPAHPPSELDIARARAAARRAGIVVHE